MKFNKQREWIHYQCEAIVTPGEYTIDFWDNQQCKETMPRRLSRCEGCEKLFCLMVHWHKHVKECDPH